MITGFKVSSWACKCVSYRPVLMQRWDPVKVNFEGLGIQKWNIPTYRAQRVDENKKNVL